MEEWGEIKLDHRAIVGKYYDIESDNIYAPIPVHNCIQPWSILCAYFFYTKKRFFTFYV